jgi:hypothetical protein
VAAARRGPDFWFCAAVAAYAANVVGWASYAVYRFLTGG